jgi:hypothetical protein
MSEQRRPRAARVRQTGIALVHEGELVLPAAGSEAEAERVLADSRNTIHYHFPVEIEVRYVQGDTDVEALIERVMNNLAMLIENQ